MIRALVISLVTTLVLAGCAAQTSSLRAPGAQMASMASFDVNRFQGRWYEVAGYHDGACAIGALTVTVQKTGDVTLTEGPCRDATPRQRVARLIGPGRLQPDDGAPLWVLWVDDGYRTAVIATPSGEFAYVLNRTRDIPKDRMDAARRILDFNGYDPAGLRRSRS